MIFGDLHIHSRFSRACSTAITLDNLEKYAKIKGLNLLGTGDFTHPKWINEVKENLKEDENGILWSKNKFPFIWQTEVSLMYSWNNKGRSVHYVLLSPNKDVTNNIVDALGKRWRLDYDGRPIFGVNSIEFLELLKGIDDKIEMIPAHCMTSFFGIYGSKSGFDSLKECFQEKAHHIHAVETGMSANPAMLWRLKENVNLVSFSDAHSFHPFRIGREATIFDFNELTYDNIIKAIRTGVGLKGTVETSPSYGKYHIDGHRNCEFSCDYKESKRLNKICPKCGNELTIGVEYRVEELAKEKIGYKPNNAKESYELIPLQELIGAVYDVKLLSSKKVMDIYNKLIILFNNELNILINVSENDLLKVLDKRLVDVILNNRIGNLKIKPGFDGVYGQIMLNDSELVVKQKSLGQF